MVKEIKMNVKKLDMNDLEAMLKTKIVKEIKIENKGNHIAPDYAITITTREPKHKDLRQKMISLIMSRRIKVA